MDLNATLRGYFFAYRFSTGTGVWFTMNKIIIQSSRVSSWCRCY